MTLKFMSDEWAKGLMEAVNESEAYRAAAADWEGDFFFTSDMGGAETATIYIDLWHGKCREAFAVDDQGEKSPDFLVSGKVSAWEKVIGKQVDPIQALMTRQLKLKGNMSKILRSVKATQELVNCATQVPTDFS
ncbi:MAG: SCP2 sterol-binding domain-containing protein [Chloroflexota bacterium]|nr:SCP2 sterol-binding domain-containing protein [Chloroflexota bacterium]